MLKTIFNEKSRANRTTYFFTTLLSTAVAFLFALLMATDIGFFMFIGLIGILACCAVSISITIDRLHDLGHTGWLYLVMFVPFINFLFGIYVLFAAGEKGPNKYGEQP